jgi:aspartate/glutamate racemase
MSRIVLIHASRAAVDPVVRYYSHTAPELDITNLLDDGVMRLLRAGDMRRAKNRLSDMISIGRDTYRAEIALLTCSAVPAATLAKLRGGAGIALLKIDEPMCDAAVRSGARIGLVVSFPPTSATTRGLLTEAATRAGKRIEIVEEQAPEALEALLAGDDTTHDAMLVAAADRLAKKAPDSIVLAQVSMASLVPRLTARLALPVFSSLASSLDAVRAILRNRPEVDAVRPS